jgi:hypothetical protein
MKYVRILADMFTTIGLVIAALYIAGSKDASSIDHILATMIMLTYYTIIFVKKDKE